MIRSCVAVILFGIVLLGSAACTDAIEAPPCFPQSFTQAPAGGDTMLTSRGLRFIDGDSGTGPALDWCSVVTLDYDAYLLDSTKFDSSRDRGVPLRFVPGVGDLIDGFEQGVIGMRTNGTRRLIIPPELGYGSEPVRDGAGSIIIPANSTLVFDVEVLLIGQ
jgi:FKBP-type peptidyl-prolyl cis-trans isomerase